MAPFFVMNAVNGVDAFQHVFNGIVHRILASLQGQALVAHVLQGDDLAGHLLLGQLLSGDVLIFQMIRTVHAAVDAIIGQVQRREDDDPVAIKIFLDLLCQGIDLLILSSSVQSKAPLPPGGSSPSAVSLFPGSHRSAPGFPCFLGVSQCLHDLLMVDKIICTF